MHRQLQKISFIAFLFLISMLLMSSTLHAFTFSEYEEKEAAEERSQAQQVRSMKDVPCSAKLKHKKVVVIIGERHNDGHLSSKQSNYGLMFNEINRRLRQLGLNTYSQKQITAQIARAEMEAVLNNDPDAAMAAGKRLGASFFIRGMISSRSGINPVLGINEVFVNMNFTLMDARGHIFSDVSVQGDSWSGSDTLGAALAIVKQQADVAVANLYHDYCTQAR